MAYAVYDYSVLAYNCQLLRKGKEYATTKAM